jgi:hypothetical protein
MTIGRLDGGRTQTESAIPTQAEATRSAGQLVRIT